MTVFDRMTSVPGRVNEGGSRSIQWNSDSQGWRAVGKMPDRLTFHLAHIEEVFNDDARCATWMKAAGWRAVRPVRPFWLRPAPRLTAAGVAGPVKVRPVELPGVGRGGCTEPLQASPGSGELVRNWRASFAPFASAAEIPMRYQPSALVARGGAQAPCASWAARTSLGSFACASRRCDGAESMTAVSLNWASDARAC